MPTSDRLYQTFLSSTYEDLQNERLAVTSAMLEMNFMPVGMEFFPASNSNPAELIRRYLRSCDYMVVVSAGKYGSIHAPSGISYTELEFTIAVEQSIPVYAFIHHDLAELPSKHIEAESSRRKKLLDFHKRLGDRTRRTYRTPEDLASQIKSTLFHAIRDEPRAGWTRHGIPESDKHNPLIGSWVFHNPELGFGATHDRIAIKHFTHNHCLNLHLRPSTNTVIYASGGDYELSDDGLVLHIRFAHDGYPAAFFGDRQFKFQVTGDELLWTGTMPNGQNIRERWKRISDDWLQGNPYDGGEAFYDWEWLEPSTGAGGA